jgi:hypothetical protein
MANEGETGYPDTFEVINGPGDGTEYPVTRTPVDVGSDPECVVLIQCDRRVDQFHARVTVVSEGYRVRHLHGGPVYVDGKRAGKFHSRIARSGSVVQVGDTELLLQCTPDGLASRSRGLPQESDVGWAVRSLLPVLLSILAVPLRPLASVLTRLYQKLIVLVVIILVISYFRPGLTSWARSWIGYAWYWILWRFGQLFHQIISLFEGFTQNIPLNR